MRHAGTPDETMETLLKCRAAGDIDAALALYEENAAIVISPSYVQHGARAVRAFLEAYTSMKPTFAVLERTIVVETDVALHVPRWSLNGTDANHRTIQATGLSSDVLRKQPSGEWLIAIDNLFAQ